MPEVELDLRDTEEGCPITMVMVGAGHKSLRYADYCGGCQSPRWVAKS